MVYQSGVGTATIDTMPTSFVSFMSINKFICCHRFQTTKCCGNGTKLKTLQNKLQTTIWPIKRHWKETFQYSDAIFPAFHLSQERITSSRNVKEGIVWKGGSCKDIWHLHVLYPSGLKFKIAFIIKKILESLLIYHFILY